MTDRLFALRLFTRVARKRSYSTRGADEQRRADLALQDGNRPGSGPLGDAEPLCEPCPAEAVPKSGRT